MKTTRIFHYLAIAFIISYCKEQSKKELNTLNPSISKIEVLDFYSTHRCITCNAIENNTKYTLETFFKNELKNGKITFKAINVDEKENEVIAEKFEASGTALILNIIKNGKEEKIDLTEFAFMYGKNKVEFSNQLRSKIQKQLDDL